MMVPTAWSWPERSVQCRKYMLASEYDEAVAMGERALALAERLGVEDVTVHALNNIGISLVKRGDPNCGLAMLQDSLRRALALSLPEDACRAYYNLGVGFQTRCRYSEARATYADLLAYADSYLQQEIIAEGATHNILAFSRFPERRATNRISRRCEMGLNRTFREYSTCSSSNRAYRIGI